MPRVRGNGAQRWASRTAAATTDYQAGVAAPRVSWQQATVAAAPAHKAALTEALAQGRFEKGVAKAGDGKWQAAAAGKGAERFGPGAAAGVNDYATAVAPYLQVIESTPLPPRGPKGDPRNIQRVAVLAAALRKKKTGFALPALVVWLGASLVGLGVLAACRGSLVRCGASGGDKTEKPISGSLAHHRMAKLFAVVAVGVVASLALAGAAIDTVTFSATAPGAGGAAGAAVAGDSLVVRNTSLDSKPTILAMWQKNQAVGLVQVTHASGHDLVRDIRMRVTAGTPLNLFPDGIGEDCEPQEGLNITIVGSAVGGQTEIGTMLLYYPTLPGIESRLIDVSALENRMVDLVTIEDTTTAAVAAAYSGARALNAASDLLKANTDYAILGAHIGVLCAALTVRGVDTGNLRVPIPGMPGRPEYTASWFVDLVEQWGMPLIPVINSANKAGIFIENVQDQALTAVPFSLMMAELSPG